MAELMNQNTGQFIAPEAWAGDLIVEPVKSTSIAALVATTTARSGRALHVPRVLEDPSAAWVAEGERIATSSPTLAEIVVTPSKVAGVVPVSNELIADSDPAAVDLVGRGLARDIARRVDQAFFGALAAPAPSGLGALADVTVVDAGTGFTNIDPFLEAATAVRWCTSSAQCRASASPAPAPSPTG
jgi:HK97 family phage major capsid protein